jgi:CubicO group peptidase (beta-lactamase class C family)
MTVLSTSALEPIFRDIAKGEIAGLVALLSRPGQPTLEFALGRRDVDAGLAIERDTIFRIASLTKPVTSVTALTFVDEGRFALDDPITGVAPEFTNVRVLEDPGGPVDRTVPVARAITFRDLLTHRSGLSYGEFHRAPIGAAYSAALGGQIDNALSPDEWIARLAALPLVDQPGAAFHYGASTDLLGFLLARMEGKPFGTVMHERVLDPLGMHDTHFTVPLDKRHRRAALTGFDEAGRLTTLAATPGRHALTERPESMTFESGGQGLWSTADDYLTFARLFTGGGAVDGVRILQSETCAQMMTNHLTPSQRAGARLLGRALFARGHGFGLGVAVVTEPDHADVLCCRGGEGTVGWPGAYGSWWQADPTDGSVRVFLSHNMVELSQLSRGIGLATWAAIASFHGWPHAG